MRNASEDLRNASEYAINLKRSAGQLEVGGDAQSIGKEEEGAVQGKGLNDKNGHSRNFASCFHKY